METKLKKNKVPMGLLALLLGAGGLIFLGASIISGVVAGGMMLGIGVIAIASVCWKMGQRGVYADWEFQVPVTHPYGCRCPECMDERHPAGCQCDECRPAPQPQADLPANDNGKGSALAVAAATGGRVDGSNEHGGN